MNPQLPYPAFDDANTFAWPDENKLRSEYSGQATYNPNAPPLLYPNDSQPYQQNVNAFDPYPSGNPNAPSHSPNPPYPTEFVPQGQPYPQQYPAGPSPMPYPNSPTPYPYPSDSTQQPAAYPKNPNESFYSPQQQAPYPSYPPDGDHQYTSGIPAAVQNVNENQMPFGIKGNKGLSKVLNTGMKIAGDALNKSSIGNYFPQPSSGQPQQSPYGPPPGQPQQSPYGPPPGQPQQRPYPGANQVDGNIFPKSRGGDGGGACARFAGQDYEALKRSCRQSGSLFKDPEFPASNRLLVDDASQSVFSYFGNAKIPDSSIEWLRPKEICRDPQMFVGEFDRFDINQGEIGNCWFLAALANLAENKNCFGRVVPMNQGFGSDYVGIFRFRFWRFGEWVEVVVDDRLPTRRGELIYVRSIERNEFWSALLEKAYAKLHGSYKNLEGGLTIEAAVDFTGGIPEMIDLQKTQMSPERIFYIMSKADARNAFMGCALSNSPRATEAQRKGLQTRHAYTITKVVEIRSRQVSGGIPLIRLRNPHGNNREWRGDWSDGDRNWKSIPSHMREQLGLTYEDDGEFYMSFRDFIRYFGELELCHLSPDSVDSSYGNKKFEVFNFFGSWRCGSTAGGCGNDGLKSFCMNPQFFVDLRDPDPYDDEVYCPVIISLMQKQTQRKKEHAIGFKVYPCDSQARRLTELDMARIGSVEKSDAFINLREISKRLLLQQGRYCIVPSTFRKGEEGDFLVRVFIEKRWGFSDGVGGQAVRDSMDSGGGDPSRGTPIDFGMHNLNIGGGGSVGVDPGRKKKKSGRDKAVGFALKKLEENFPQHAKGLQKLKNFYNWATDSESEFALLNNIIKSLR